MGLIMVFGVLISLLGTLVLMQLLEGTCQIFKETEIAERRCGQTEPLFHCTALSFDPGSQ